MKALPALPALPQPLQALFRHKIWTVVLLLAPLLIFMLGFYLLPLGTMFVRSVYTPVFSEVLPETTVLLRAWDGRGMPDAALYPVFAHELAAARKQKTLGKAIHEVNRIQSGARSLIITTARHLTRAPPKSVQQETLTAIRSEWGEPHIWLAMRLASAKITARFYLNALDLTYGDDGSIVRQPEDKRIYVKLMVRTLLVSIAITLFCFLLGYPLAYLMAQARGGLANVLLLAVLAPFWTSLLVRTTSWIVLLQQQGVLNGLLVWLGVVDDQNRLSLIYNMTGTLVAMTHVLLPFMILPMYSVMRTIPPTYMSAAISLGASFPQAFYRVYWPLSLPGAAAGGLLVFILSIGYYITPALVGGQRGQLISNFIAYHVQGSLNWGLAAALGMLLLVSVKILYVVYERVVGADRLRLG